MSIRKILWANHGAMRVRDVTAHGIGRHAITRAIQTRAVLVPRRGWIALPEAEAEFLLAVASGTVLSCVTGAKQLGLWVTEDPPRPHHATPTPVSRVTPAGQVLHWHRPVKPRVPGALIDNLENILSIVAHCLSFEDAVATWESALRQGMTTLEALDQLPLKGRARKVLAYAQPYSDSGLESLFRARLRWLRVPIRQQVVLRGRPVDFLIDERLVVQVDGGHHVGLQRDADIRHDAELALDGYRVIRLSYRHIIDDWLSTQDLILDAIARGLTRRA